MQLTAKNISLTVSILGFLATAGTQLTDVFSPFGSYAPLIVKEIVSLSTLGTGILGVVLAVLTGQSGQLRAVQAMPGVEAITINENADLTAASMALDETNPKIQVAPGAEKAVQVTVNKAQA